MSHANSKPPRRIALVDCNNFYASCERVFNPAWRSRPVGVLSNNDGCIVARSNELKEAGIPMGAPYFKHKDQLAKLGAVIVSSNYTLYGDMSARVMNTLSQFVPETEVYSIDEAWLELTPFDPGTLDAYGREIVATTHKRTGIPVSMGIGPTKVLAKLANRVCKKRKIPGGVFNLGGAECLDSVLAAVDVGDVWGVGRRWAEKLNALGIFTALDLRQADPADLRHRFSVVMQRLVYELQGVNCLEFEDVQPKKQIVASRSFGDRVEDIDQLKEAVSFHATRAAEKLRRQHSACGMMQVAIRNSRFSEREPYVGRQSSIRFSIPTADTRRLIGAACNAIDQIYIEGVRYAKAGVILNDLVPAGTVQASLFGGNDDGRSAALMRTLDELNRTYGRQTAFFGSQGTRQAWNMKRDRMTPAYTTRWSDLPVVR